MARSRKSSAGSLPPSAGAKPPSSPTPVDRPWSFSSCLSVWKISTPMRSASLNDPAPAGTSMNSCTSRPLSAWAPPFSTFMSGTGRMRAPGPPRYWYSGRPASSAEARAAASETPRSALAPRPDLLGVPSSSSSAHLSGVGGADLGHGSGLPFEDEAPEGANGLGARPQHAELLLRVADQERGAGPGGLDAVNRGIGRLLLDLVLARGLAELLGARDHVEDVVHDLEGESQIGARHAQRLHLSGVGPAEHRADAEGRADERARLVRVDVVH